MTQEWWLVLKNGNTIYAIVAEESAAKLLCSNFPDLSYDRLPKDVEARFKGV